MTDPSTFQALADSLRGQLVRPEDAGYDDARAVYNAMIDKRPGAIAVCADVADVIACVKFAAEHDVLLAIRGGGHNGGGLGICDGGLVIDLSAMKWVRPDPVSRTVRVGGGCTLGDVDHATHPFGLAIPGGVISTTGVGGLTLGGGLGYLTRKYGLTIDNLLEADLVLADGSVVTASPDQYEDLFWAIRGGGGNFGVVTSFLFRAHPVDTVCAGPMLWHAEDTELVLKWYRDFLPQAPEDLNGVFAFLIVPGPPFPEPLHGKPMCGVVWCWLGDPDQLEAALAPARDLKTPAFEHVGPMPYPAMQSMFDAVYPPGHQWYWRADFLNEIPDPAVEKHIEFGTALPTALSTMHLYPIDGATRAIGKEETPWVYRDAAWAEVIVGVDPDPANSEKITQWTKAYWEALHPYSAGGAYVNFMMDDEGQERVRATYGDNYNRLAQIKKKYDPGNLFRVNQNIRPA
jgi:FAD/FMN-containing dehydrogenase